jgi:hypothetical protein
MLKYLYGKLPVASKLNGGREERMGELMPPKLNYKFYW